MIYLILKIFFYLLVALLLGGAGGWLARNVAAARREESLQRALTEARARVPQFETLMRARDQQVQRLKDDNKAKDQQLAELGSKTQSLEESLRTRAREQSRTAVPNETLDLDDGSVLAVAAEEDGADVAELRAELARLTEELARVRGEMADAVAEAAAAESELASLRGGVGQPGPHAQAGADAALREHVQELERLLQQTNGEHAGMSRMLETERRRVAQLERERELQNRSLRVLHEQLEFERERSAPERHDEDAPARRTATHLTAPH